MDEQVETPMLELVGRAGADWYEVGPNPDLERGLEGQLAEIDALGFEPRQDDLNLYFLFVRWGAHAISL
jgi:hypothetical protein